MRIGPALLVAGCQGAAPAPPDECLSLSFRADPAIEAYECFGFDVGRLEGESLTSVAFDAPATGVVVLHHVALYATSTDYADGPVPCEDMPPDATELDVWVPGAEPLVLPPDVGLLLPAGTRKLVVQAHALRTEAGPAGDGVLHVCIAGSPRANEAAWLAARAPVPALRPHFEETSTAVCAVGAPVHLFSTWPHMHLAGKEFHGAVRRADGTDEPLVDVVPWVFTAQRAYRVDVDLEAGDAIETTCIWENQTDDYILPGPRTVDEMCGQSLIVWPAAAAACAPTEGSS